MLKKPEPKIEAKEAKVAKPAKPAKADKKAKPVEATAEGAPVKAIKMKVRKAAAKAAMNSAPADAEGLNRRPSLEGGQAQHGQAARRSSSSKPPAKAKTIGKYLGFRLRREGVRRPRLLICSRA